MIRVCCLCERWESGGIESFLTGILTHTDLTNLDVDIVASSIGESVFTKVLQQYGVHFFELSGSQKNIVKNHCKFRQLARERKYNILYLNAFQGLSLAYLKIAKEYGISVRIAHSHNTALRKSLGQNVKLLIHRLARKRYTAYATDLWACSHAAAKFLFDSNVLKKRDFQFIPNGIDASRFRFNPEIRSKLRMELGIENNFVVGNIGRLCYQKNQIFLFDVFADMVKRSPDARLLLVGDGEDRLLLTRKAEDLHISNKIIFYGNTDHPEHLLWCMDVFAFPSLFEGFGIVAIEALAAGLPVICSENVPKEICIDSQIQIIPLSKGVSLWASALLAQKRPNNRFNDTVKKAGFDITDTVRIVREHFIEEGDSKCQHQNI